MGRVRTLYIKRISKELLEKYNNLFSTDFNKNKESLNKISEYYSKTIRNKIAGAITHMVKEVQKNE